MKPSPFSYHRPRSVDEALSVLAECGEGGKVLAGGQSLVPLMSMRLVAPGHLVDINHIPGLDTIDVGERQVRVGATARHSAVEHDLAAYDAAPLLRQGLVNVAHPTIRNRGTTVGSIVHADPASEMPAVLCLLDGVMELVSTSGTREVPAGEFFVGPLESDVRTGELAVAARFTRPPLRSGSAFVEVSRRHGDYALCGVGAVVTLAPDNAFVSGRVALVNVDVRPVLVDVTQAITGSGGGFDDGLVRDLVDDAIVPEADIHASAEYRRHLAHVLAGRALDEAGMHAVSRGGAR